jgi:hypothetical protein
MILIFLHQDSYTVYRQICNVPLDTVNKTNSTGRVEM